MWRIRVGQLAGLPLRGVLRVPLQSGRANHAVGGGGGLSDGHPKEIEEGDRERIRESDDQDLGHVLHLRTRGVASVPFVTSVTSNGSGSLARAIKPRYICYSRYFRHNSCVRACLHKRVEGIFHGLAAERDVLHARGGRDVREKKKKKKR